MSKNRNLNIKSNSTLKTNTPRKSFVPFVSYWTKVNYLLLAVGVILLVVGYWMLGVGSWNNPLSLNVAPYVLISSYLVFLPAAILYKKKEVNREKDPVNQPS